MNPFYNLVADRAAHRCEYCHDPELVFNFTFEVKHIVPICRGGADAWDSPSGAISTISPLSNSTCRPSKIPAAIMQW